MAYNAKDYFEVMNNDPTVYGMMCRGADLGSIVIELAKEKAKLREEIAILRFIAPRKYRDEQGRLMVWRCPVELIPESL